MGCGNRCTCHRSSRGRCKCSRDGQTTQQVLIVQEAWLGSHRGDSGCAGDEGRQLSLRLGRAAALFAWTLFFTRAIFAGAIITRAIFAGPIITRTLNTRAVVTRAFITGPVITGPFIAGTVAVAVIAAIVIAALL